jgi:enamidase
VRRLLQLMALAAVTVLGPAAVAQAPNPDAAFLAYAQPVIAFTHVQLVDGTGAPAKADVTVVVKDGRIAAVGPAGAVAVPAGAEVIDGRGKTLLPGFVMMHEHMFYPTGKANYTENLTSFPRLYLAGGTTTMRTGGTTAPYADLNLREEIRAGRVLGPDLDVTGPYLNGPGLPILKIHAIRNAAEARRMVNYWADEGVTSFKGYMQLTRAELKAIVETAHRRGIKVTGHLCSITAREAAAIGIDNIEHAFAASTDWVAGKKPDSCPDQGVTAKSLADLDPDGPEAGAVIDALVRRGVALTSTLTVFETFTAGRPMAPDGARALLIPQTRKQYETTWAAIQKRNDPVWQKALRNEMRLEKRFVQAGGWLMAGTDPTGYGGVIAGYSSKRQVQLLVEAGFSFPEALKISTLNGARFMGREREIGTVEPGKRADLILIDGDPVKDASALDRMPLVFKAGRGYRTAAIFEAMKETVGLY